jgi:hypothetical protein
LIGHALNMKASTAARPRTIASTSTSEPPQEWWTPR